MQNYEELVDQFKVIRSLNNKLYYSSILEVEDRIGKKYIAKKYDLKTSDIGTLQKQFNVYNSLKHQNLIKFIDVRPNASYKDKNQNKSQCFAMILQHVDGVQLWEIIRDHPKYSENTIRTFFFQLITCINYIHSKGYAHRSIQPSSILIDKNTFNLKLTNFGFCCQQNSKSQSNVSASTKDQEIFSAPQIKKKDLDVMKADIFSAGMILYFMYLGKSPFSKAQEQDQGYKKIINKQYQSFWKIRDKQSTLDKNFKNLFVKMIAKDPSERPTTRQIMNDPWLKGKLSSFNQIQIQFDKKTIKKVKQKQNISQRDPNLRGIQQQDPFQQIYSYELNTDRDISELQIKDVNDDFIISWDLPLSFALLKNFLQNQPIPIQTQSKQVHNLKSSNVEDLFDGLSAKYQLNYQIQDQQFNYEVELQIKFGRTQKQNLAVIITHISGDTLYFKKIVGQIKNVFSQYVVKQ